MTDYLRKYLATDEELKLFAPFTNVISSAYEWTEPLLVILAEDFSVFDAHIVDIKFHSAVVQDISRMQCSVYFFGKCPLCRLHHGNNRWAIMRTEGYNEAFFYCFKKREGRKMRWSYGIPYGSSTY